MRPFHRWGIVALVLIPWSVYADQYRGLLRRYEKQIQEQETHLRKLRADLRTKDREALAWKTRAQAAKQEWSQTGARKESTESQLRQIKNKVSDLQKRSIEASLSASQLHVLHESSLQELRILVTDFYKKHLAFSSHLGHEGTEETLRPVLRAVTGLASRTQSEVRTADSKLLQLRVQQTSMHKQQEKHLGQWARLKEQQEDHWIQWQQAVRRRQILEEERSQLEQSAQALRVVLKELRRARDEAKGTGRGTRPTSTQMDSAFLSMRGTLAWPANGRVVQPFGRFVSSELNQLTVSNGIRIQTQPGRSIRAVRDGVVLYARSFQQYGKLVIVQHTNGLTSIYGGLGSIDVAERATIGALQTLGQADESGRFYFELRREEQPVNPLTLLAPQSNATSRS